MFHLESNCSSTPNFRVCIVVKEETKLCVDNENGVPEETLALWLESIT